MHLCSLTLFLENLVIGVANDATTWALALTVPSFIVLVCAASCKRLSALPNMMWGGLVLMGAAVILFYGAICWMYAASPQFWDHCEPTVASLSWYFRLGKDVYPAPSEGYFGFQYGPYLYIFNGMIEAFLGPSIFSSKLGGVLAACGSMLAIFFLVRRYCSTSIAVLATSLSVAMQLQFSHFSFWTRSDPFLVFFVSAACLAVTFPSWWAAVVVGIASGVCINLKIHSILYFIPLFACARRTLSLRHIAMAMGIGCIVWMAPFCIFQNISLQNYFAALKGAVIHGFDPGTYAVIMKWCFRLAMPVGLLAILAYLQNPDRARHAFGNNKTTLALLVLSFMLMLIPASKYGSGGYHFMPFLPVVVLVVACLHHDGLVIQLNHSRSSFLVYACLTSWIASSLSFAGLCLRTMKWRVESNAPLAKMLASEIQSVLAQYGDTHTVLMGQAGGPAGGGQYELTYLRPLLVFKGMPIGLEPPPLMDKKKAGGTTPLAYTIGKSPGAKPVMWMIPKGNDPFMLKTWYPPYNNLYDERFRKDFLSLYSVSSQTPHFDLYTLRKKNE